MHYRVLRIPHGQEKDSSGRDLGSDWLLASCGATDDASFYVTTDRVRCSEFDGPDAKETAELLLKALNAREDARNQLRLEVG